MSRQTCLEVVERNRRKIRDFIEEFLDLRQLMAIEIFVFKSRVVGTCKPHSDIDIYVNSFNSAILLIATSPNDNTIKKTRDTIKTFRKRKRISITL